MLKHYKLPIIREIVHTIQALGKISQIILLLIKFTCASSFFTQKLAEFRLMIDFVNAI